MCCYKKKPIKVIWKNIILVPDKTCLWKTKSMIGKEKQWKKHVSYIWEGEGLGGGWEGEMQKIFFWPSWKRLVNPQYFLKHVYKLLETFVILVMIKLLKFIGFPFCTLIKLLKFTGFTCLVFNLALKEHSCFVNFDHWHVYHENRKKKRKKCIS